MLKPAPKKRLVDAVADQIEEAIIARDFKPGEKLPKTDELRSILGASIGTIREAVAILKQKGLVEVRKGAKGGIFVCQVSTDSVAASLGLLIRHMKISPKDLAEFRQNVEAGMLKLAIKRATDEELNEISKYRMKFRACLNRGDEGWKDLLKIEAKLRKYLVRLTQNPAYEAVLLPIYNNILNYASALLPGNDALNREAFDDWMKIISAFINRDAETVVSITRDHIYRFQIHLEEGQKQE